jgi:metal-responsive CopG/Arc/MetJ family transcriptional regulator
VKTAISLPDETFDRASRRAAELGISRSEFFATAARRYLDDLDARSLTGQIDAALAVAPAPDTSSTHAVAAGRRLLSADEDW